MPADLIFPDLDHKIHLLVSGYSVAHGNAHDCSDSQISEGALAVHRENSSCLAVSSFSLNGASV